VTNRFSSKKYVLLPLIFKKFHIEGIGIGAPGIVDVQKGFIYYLPNVPGWEKISFGRNVGKKSLEFP